jgi:putative transposase
VIRRRGLWRLLETVEQATLDRVDWYNNCCRREPIGNMSPAQAEARHYAQRQAAATAAWLKPTRFR